MDNQTNEMVVGQKRNPSVNLCLMLLNRLKTKCNPVKTDGLCGMCKMEQDRNVRSDK